LTETLEKEGITAVFDQKDSPTGICPSLVLGSERTLCSFDGASAEY